MDFMPPGDRVPTGARVRRSTVAAIAVVCITVGAAIVLERLTHSAAQRPPGVAALPATPSGR